MSMSRRALSLSVVSAALAVPSVISCSGPLDPGDGGMLGGSSSGGSANGGAAPGGAGGASPTGGATTGGVATGGATTGGVSGATATGGAAGVSGSAGSTTTGGSGGAATGGTAGTGMGGAPGGMGGTAGSGIAGSFVGGGMGGAPMQPPLNCGGKGTAVENDGPPANRLNYVIVGDGYSEAQLPTGGTLDMHIQAAMTKRFSDPIGQPYLRYRKFVNICVIRLPVDPHLRFERVRLLRQRFESTRELQQDGREQRDLAKHAGRRRVGLARGHAERFELVELRRDVDDTGRAATTTQAAPRCTKVATATTSSPTSTATANRAASAAKPPTAST